MQESGPVLQVWPLIAMRSGTIESPTMTSTRRRNRSNQGIPAAVTPRSSTTRSRQHSARGVRCPASASRAMAKPRRCTSAGPRTCCITAGSDSGGLSPSIRRRARRYGAAGSRRSGPSMRWVWMSQSASLRSRSASTARLRSCPLPSISRTTEALLQGTFSRKSTQWPSPSRSRCPISPSSETCGVIQGARWGCSSQTRSQNGCSHVGWRSIELSSRSGSGRAMMAEARRSIVAGPAPSPPRARSRSGAITGFRPR